MSAQQAFLFTKEGYQFVIDLLESQRRQIQNLSAQLGEVKANSAKSKQAWEAKIAWCGNCKRPPTVSMIHCEHAFCGECTLRESNATGKLRCRICTGLASLLLAPSPGMTVKQDGQRWIASPEMAQSKHEGSIPALRNRTAGDEMGGMDIDDTQSEDEAGQTTEFEEDMDT